MSQLNATAQPLARPRRRGSAGSVEPTPWADAVPAPLLGIDGSDRIRFVCAAAADLFAAARRPILGQSLDDAFGLNAPLAALVRRARSSEGTVTEADLSLVGPGFALGQITALAAPAGVDGQVSLLLLPTPRTRAAPLAPSHTAARTLAHEVRNPLAGIRAAAQLIARGEDEGATTLANLICDEVDRIRRLTDRIDPLDALGPTTLTPVNVHEALGRVRALIASSAPHVRLHERYDPSLPAIRGDLDQLIQAFLNIAQNAVEAMNGREGAALTLATAFRSGVRLRAAGGPARAQLEVRFIDNGPGIEPEVSNRLFEAFATTKPGGMGLGLTISAEIVARHGGGIEVDSLPGRTVFAVTLPIDAEASL